MALTTHVLDVITRTVRANDYVVSTPTMDEELRTGRPLAYLSNLKSRSRMSQGNAVVDIDTESKDPTLPAREAVDTSGARRDRGAHK